MTPLIKSHTGAMVTARVGMVVTCNDGFLRNQFEIVKVNNKYIFDPDGDAYSPASCTMLHCPFQVGDDYQWLDGDKWRNGRSMGKNDVEKINSGKSVLKYRHASLDLRDSPDYQPTGSDV